MSFELHAGEVLGLAGLIGSGRSSLGRALFGQRPATSGTIEVAGRVRRLRSVPSAIAAGIGMVPEDRQSQGLFMPDDALSNTALVRLSDFVHGWLIADRKARAFARRQLAPLSIRGDIEAPVRELSGGNQQKVLLAKWLAASPSVLILDEPTRGVDVGVRAEIYRIVDHLAEQGTGVAVDLVGHERAADPLRSDPGDALRESRGHVRRRGRQRRRSRCRRPRVLRRSRASRDRRALEPPPPYAGATTTRR